MIDEIFMDKIKLFKRELRHYDPIVRRRALEALYDDSREDITTKALGLMGASKAYIIAEKPGILCGLIEADSVFTGMKVRHHLAEGAKFKRGSIILEVAGDISEILKRERTALNYLQLLSGIATLSRSLTDKFGKFTISALRKNHPLLTESEKRAVQVGDGLAHRMSLADGYLIKNTHIESLKKKYKLDASQAIKLSVAQAVKHRRQSHIHYFVEVEAHSLQEAVAAAKTQADTIMIDNQPPKRFREIVRAIRKVNSVILIEASGGITPNNAKLYLDAGARFVSMSYLAMRARPINMHLKLVF
jgi:nicotinate-nucleotide pyrophosphorylase (carboxylating)